MTQLHIETVVLLLPEILLILAAAALFVGSAFIPSRPAWLAVSTVAVVVAAAVLFWQDTLLLNEDRLSASTLGETSGPVFVDSLGHAVRWLSLAVGLLLLLMFSRTGTSKLFGEISGCIMLITAGMMLSASASNLILLFLGLELISIPSYVILFLGKRGEGSFEATIKYFLLSILSSAFLLYGLSFLYGVTASTNLVDIASRFAAQSSIDELLPLDWPVIVAVVGIVAGLGFKIAAVPFHFYAPDVYQGTSNTVAGLLAVAPKVAGIVALVRIVVIAMSFAAPFAWQIMFVVSVITMTLGNICALWQSNIRRLLAYSSIAHAGYMLIGVSGALAAAGTDLGREAVAAVIFYLVVYSIATLGTFSALAFLGKRNSEISRLDELAGLSNAHPALAMAIAVFMFSLSGLPPLAGFWGKFALFANAVALGLVEGAETSTASMWFIVLAIVGGVNAAIAAAYYVRIVAMMYFQPTGQRVAAEGGLGSLSVLACMVMLVVAFGVFLPSKVSRFSRWAAQSYPAKSRSEAAIETTSTTSARRLVQTVDQAVAKE